MGRVARCLLGRLADDLAFDSLSGLPRTSSARKVLLDARDAQFGKPVAPTPYGVDLHASLRRLIPSGKVSVAESGILIRLPLRSSQNHLGALRLPHGNLAPPGPLLKGRSLTLAEVDLGGDAHGSPPAVGREGIMNDLIMTYIYESYH